MLIDPNNIPQDPKVENTPLDDLMLQSGPMRVIDRLLYCKHELRLAQSLIKADNAFLENGLLSPECYLEMIAQAVAASNTYLTKKPGEPIKEGYIVGCRNFKIHKTVGPGALLLVCAVPIKVITPLSLFNGTVFCDSLPVAEGQAKFYLE